MTEKNPTIQDIKKSLDYRWRVKQASVYWFLFAFLFAFLMIAALVMAIRDHFSVQSIMALCMCAICTLLFGSVLIGMALYYYGKARSIIRNRERLIPCTVLLNSPVLACHSKGVSWHYYVVYIDLDMNVIQTRTNTLFRHFDLPKYNGSRMTALYDAEADRVYLIQKL